MGPQDKWPLLPGKTTISPDQGASPNLLFGIGDQSDRPATGWLASGIRQGGQANGGSVNCLTGEREARGSDDGSTSGGPANGASTGDSAGGRGDDGLSATAPAARG